MYDLLDMEDHRRRSREREEEQQMKADVIILSKTRALVAKALASLASTADKKRIGKVWIGWTGEDKYEPQDIEICGLDVSMLSLPFYNFA